jgi:predicted ArsR family transcriptional regulator
MDAICESSDVAILDLLRKSGSMTIAGLAGAMGVTATAVRQRLARLMSQGLIEREVAKVPRGRPTHRYLLTDKGRRQTGANFIDLALALWQEIRAIKDQDVRKGLLQRVAAHLATMYRPQVKGESTAERMESVAQLLGERKVPFEVDKSGALPVLTALACPYPELAEQDRGICAVESMLFRELVGDDLRLTECRLDGEATCCRFETR